MKKKVDKFLLQTKAMLVIGTGKDAVNIPVEIRVDTKRLKVKRP